MTDEELRPAPKIFKDTCRIDWNRSAKQVYDFIRGLSPYPAAWTTLVDTNGTETVLKIYEAERLSAVQPRPCGTLETDGKSYLYVHTSDGALSIRSLQLAGKKRMGVGDFLRGSRLGEGCMVK